MRVFTGLVVLVLLGKNSTKQKKTQHTFLVILCNLGHVYARGCIVLGFQMLQVLIVKGDVAISVTMGSVLYIPGLV